MSKPENPIPVRGIGYRLDCPHNCEGVVLPGDDPGEFEYYPMRYSVAIAKCVVRDRFYYANTIWSNL